MNDFYLGLIIGGLIGTVLTLFTMAPQWPDRLDPRTMEWE
jgi:gas vesicle protein